MLFIDYKCDSEKRVKNPQMAHLHYITLERACNKKAEERHNKIICKEDYKCGNFTGNNSKLIDWWYYESIKIIDHYGSTNIIFVEVNNRRWYYVSFVYLPSIFAVNM